MNRDPHTAFQADQQRAAVIDSLAHTVLDPPVESGGETVESTPETPTHTGFVPTIDFLRGVGYFQHAMH